MGKFLNTKGSISNIPNATFVVLFMQPYNFNMVGQKMQVEKGASVALGLRQDIIYLTYLIRLEFP